MPINSEDLVPSTMADSPNPQVDPSAQMDTPIGASMQPPSRKSLLKDKGTILDLIIKTYRDDLQDRLIWMEHRIQRTAKYRGWREKKTFPWEDASNAHLPIIMTDVQRTEDTLHNAVLSVRPVMNAKAASKEFEERERTVDYLIDHQVFVENKGEDRVGNLISTFVQDGQFIAYCPYMRDKQRVTRTISIDFPPAQVSWDSWIMGAIKEYYPKAIVLPGPNAPWGWTLREDHPLTGTTLEFKASVYKDDATEKVQILCAHDELIFDGPAIIPVELEDIVTQGRSENLQPLTMSNPMGAHHVYMVDYPTKDEIKRLAKSGFYDELSEADIATIDTPRTDPRNTIADAPQAQKLLKDDLAGIDTGAHVKPEQQVVTRLTYFGRADLDGDGLEEEVVYWIIEEPKMMLRARYLTEVYPINPPRRPFAMAKYLPVNGQFYAIGLIELMESCYDIIKKTFDQMVDAGDLANTPWGFYRPMSGIRPETIRMGPGDLYPTNSPKDDVFYPQLPQGMQAFGTNMITMVMQILDQTTLIGSLQLGEVPGGKSAALRTTKNMQALLQQGDARPERVLRRFFVGLREVWEQFHELNQVFLPKSKMFRISTGETTNVNPYVSIQDKSAIAGRYVFEFGASILNTNRAIATEALHDMITLLLNPLLFQLGIETPEKAYTLLRDYVRARGQDPLKYINAPSGVNPLAYPKISVEDAIEAIMNGYFPHGTPMEPLQVHVQKLQEFVSDKDNIDFLTPGQAQLLGQYAAAKIDELQQLMQQQQIQASAAAFQAQHGQGNNQQGIPPKESATKPPNTSPAGNPKVQGKELLNESLPGAGRTTGL